jgi:SOS-response transcriptional repressor LexA
MIKVTERQLETLDFIKAYIGSNSIPPSMMEISLELDVFPNAAQGHVAALVKKGALTVTTGKMRSIVLVKGAKVVLK